MADASEEKGYDEEYETGYENGYVEEEPQKIAEEYAESKYYQCCTRCCGRCWFLVLMFCIVAWIVHSLVLAEPDPCFLEVLAASRENRAVQCSQADLDAGRAHWDLAPSFSKTLMWMSLAHHTDPWQEHWQRSAPPPPPNFERL